MFIVGQHRVLCKDDIWKQIIKSAKGKHPTILLYLLYVTRYLLLSDAGRKGGIQSCKRIVDKMELSLDSAPLLEQTTLPTGNNNNNSNTSASLLPPKTNSNFPSTNNPNQIQQSSHPIQQQQQSSFPPNTNDNVSTLDNNNNNNSSNSIENNNISSTTPNDNGILGLDLEAYDEVFAQAAALY